MSTLWVKMNTLVEMLNPHNINDPNKCVRIFKKLVWTIVVFLFIPLIMPVDVLIPVLSVRVLMSNWMDALIVLVVLIIITWPSGIVQDYITWLVM